MIAWSFYPKLLAREGKGWRNVANNQAITLSPASVNKKADQSTKWLSFYSILMSSNQRYNANETSAVEELAIALLCGDAEFKVSRDPSVFKYDTYLLTTSRCTPAS